MPYYSTKGLANYEKMRRKKNKVCAACGMKHSPPKPNGRFIRRRNADDKTIFRTIFSLGKRVIVHHIDGNPKNDDPKNLIYLCDNCHGLAHMIRDRPMLEAKYGKPIWTQFEEGFAKVQQAIEQYQNKFTQAK